MNAVYQGLDELGVLFEVETCTVMALTKLFDVPTIHSLVLKRGRLRIEGVLNAELGEESLADLIIGIRALANLYEGRPLVEVGILRKASLCA